MIIDVKMSVWVRIINVCIMMYFPDINLLADLFTKYYRSKIPKHH